MRFGSAFGFERRRRGGVTGGGATGGVGTLGALAMSATSFLFGTPSSGTITGASIGSTVSASGLPAGLTINGPARTWAWSGSGSASSGSLTLTETLAGYTNSPHANVIGYSITGGTALSALTLTETSAAGTNPPTWDWLGAVQDGDTLELYATTNGTAPAIAGAPFDTHIADAREETITWANWPSAFANGTTVKWAMRYGRNPGTGMVWSPLSNILTDFMPVPSNVTSIQRGIYNIDGGFGSGPFTKNGIAIAGGGKIVLTIVFYANPLNGQSMTGVTANAGAITFTRAAGIGATDGKQIWYADVASGVTHLDLTFAVGGSTVLIDFAVDELTGAAAGGPSSIYRTEHDDTTSVDGGLVIPTSPQPGIGVLGIWSAGGTAFNGATKQAEGAVDGFSLDLSIAYLAATGAVNVSGPSGNMWVINSAWGYGGAATDASKIAYAGDSFTSSNTNAGTGEAPGNTKWAGLYAAHNTSLTHYDFAVGGTGISGTNGFSSKLSAIIAANPRWVVALFGQNDAGGWQTNSASSWCTEYFGYCATLRSAGCKVALCTLIPHDVSAYSGQADPATFVAGVNSWIASVNAILRGAVGTQIDRLIDFAADSILGDPAQTGDSTWRSDGLHPTGAGQARFGDIAIGEIDAWIAGGHDVTPLAKFFADASGATAGATVTAAPIIFEHLGFGETATVTVGGGGKHRKNATGSFVTTALTVTNDDSYEVQNVASATAGGAVDTPVSVNGTLFDTFTITTVGGTPAGFVATQASQTFSGAFGAGSSHSFSVTHAGGRPCFVLNTNGGRVFTSVTVNGASCTPVISIPEGTMFTAPVGDIAAGTVTVAVTCDNSIGDLTIWYGELTGSDQLAAVGSASLGFGFRFDGVQSATSSVSPGGNDIGVLFGHRDGGVTLNSVGLTGGAVVKDYGDWFFGKFTGSGAPNFTTTGNGNSAMLVGVFS